MNYKDNFELAYTNKYGETMTLKLDDENNMLIKHDDISATSNFVPLNREFFKNYCIPGQTMSNDEVVALKLSMKALDEFAKSRFKRLANNIACSLDLDYEFQYQSE